MPHPNELAKIWVRVHEEDTDGAIVYVVYDQAPKGNSRYILDLKLSGEFITDLEEKGRASVVYGKWESDSVERILTLRPNQSKLRINWRWIVIGDRLLLSELV